MTTTNLEKARGARRFRELAEELKLDDDDMLCVSATLMVRSAILTGTELAPLLRLIETAYLAGVTLSRQLGETS